MTQSKAGTQSYLISNWNRQLIDTLTSNLVESLQKSEDTALKTGTTSLIARKKISKKNKLLEMFKDLSDNESSLVNLFAPSSQTIQSKQSTTKDWSSLQPSLDCIPLRLFRRIEPRESGSGEKLELESHTSLGSTVISTTSSSTSSPKKSGGMDMQESQQSSQTTSTLESQTSDTSSRSGVISMP